MAKTTSKKGLVTILVVLVLLAGGIAVFIFINSRSSENSGLPTETSNGYTNLSPATKEDQQSSDSHKQPSSQQTTQTTNPAASKTTVYPQITSTSQTNSALLVNGFVAGVVEDGGTCTLTASSGGKSITTTKTAASSATNTTCGQMSLDLSSLPAGTWSLRLSYSSTDASGTSGVKSVQVR